MIMRRRDGTPFVGKSSSGPGAKAKKDLILMLRDHAPSEPFTGPLAVYVGFIFPFRKSETKARKKLRVIPHDRRPDIDKLLKIFLDCLASPGSGSARYIFDDSQIATIHAEKFWGEDPGIKLSIAEWGVSHSEFA